MLSYRKQPRSPSFRRRPNRFLSASYLTNQQAEFRKAWDAGMAEAELKIKRLKEEGWIVETGRTFMGEKGDLASMAPAGMDMETVPVASWEGQQIVFVAFRSKTAPVVPSVTQAPQAQVRTVWATNELR